MRYADLLPYFRMFRKGKITKREVAVVIAMWQRAGARI
jgi:hypothetical protein